MGIRSVQGAIRRDRLDLLSALWLDQSVWIGIRSVQGAIWTRWDGHLKRSGGHPDATGSTS
jgi:hypothetical protein